MRTGLTGWKGFWEAPGVSWEVSSPHTEETVCAKETSLRKLWESALLK